MRYEECTKKEKYEQAIGYLYHLLAYHDDTLEKVSFLKKRNKTNRLVTSVTVYIADLNGNVFPKQFRFLDDQAVWFLNVLSLDFPELPLEDLSEETQEEKHGT